MREIHYDVSDNIATLVIDRPDKRGAMTYQMLEAFREHVAEASADREVRVLVITGSGGSFCSGIDLSDLAGRETDARGDAGSSEGLVLLDCAKPVIAAVDGPAVGMGAEFTCQADLRLASTRARFRWNFGHRGLVPDTGAGSWLLPRQIGMSAALRLLFTGDELTAEQARDLGYVEEVTEPERLHAAAHELATRVAATSPFAIARTKRLVYDGASSDLTEHLGATRRAMAECFASEDHAEGVAAFLERRPARFSGR